MRILLTSVLALLLHSTLGWGWTVLAGLAAGGWIARPTPGLKIGAAGVGLEWAAWVVFSYLTAAPATGVMLNTVGGVMGNSPPALVVGATVCIGALLGALGGLTGGLLGRLFDRRPTVPEAA